MEPTPAIKYQLENCNGGGMPIFEEVPSDNENEVVMAEILSRPSTTSYAIPQSPENTESSISQSLIQLNYSNNCLKKPEKENISNSEMEHTGNFSRSNDNCLPQLIPNSE